MHIKIRQAQYCNLKLALLFFVIYGHLIETRIGESPILMTQYKLIYTIHMPLFIFLSGFFLKTESTCLRQAQNCFQTYFLAQSIYVLLQWYWGKQATFWKPYWHLWYLLSLTCWALLAYCWHRLTYHISTRNRIFIQVCVLIGSIVVGCIIGTIPEVGRVLSLSRTIVFLPYFFAGVFCPKNIHWNNYRIWATILLFIGIVLFFQYKNHISYLFLYQASWYGKLGIQKGISQRLLCYCIATCFGIFLLTFFSDVHLPWTKIGIETKWIYLFHAPIIILCRNIPMTLSLFFILAPFIALYILFVLYKLFQWYVPVCGITDQRRRRYD